MKIALLDKDGTLVTSTNSSGFVTLPEDQVIRKESVEIVERLLDLNYNLIVVSNQGGVEAGYKTQQAAIDEMLYCNQLFVNALNKPVFSAFFFCPDFKGEHCWKCEPWAEETTYNRNSWKVDPYDLKGGLLEQGIGTTGTYRKPGAGMLKIALTYEPPSLEDALMIGDRPEDLLAAQNAGVKFVYIDKALGWLNKKYPKVS